VQLLGLYLKGVRLEAGLTIEEIGKRLNGLAPADLQAICMAAKRMAFNRIANSDQLPPLSWSDFERATERVRGDRAQLDNTGLQ
jgi:SpoVK/Ycf46/Vps4 family AAA+-type ATPase